MKPTWRLGRYGCSKRPTRAGARSGCSASASIISVPKRTRPNFGYSEGCTMAALKGQPEGLRYTARRTEKHAEGDARRHSEKGSAGEHPRTGDVGCVLH